MPGSNPAVDSLRVSGQVVDVDILSGPCGRFIQRDKPSRQLIVFWLSTSIIVNNSVSYRLL